MSRKSSFPESLKRLEASDLLTIKDKNDDYLLVTKQETAKIIRDFISEEIGNIPDDISEKHKKELLYEINKKMSFVEKTIKDRLNELEKELSAFIDFKFDTLAEKACDMLLTRKFMEEVDKKAEEKLIKKQAKGKF
jgi:hypothetical protein